MVLWFSLAHSSDEVTVLLRKGGLFFTPTVEYKKKFMALNIYKKSLKKRKDRNKNWEQKQEHNKEMLLYAHLSP